MYVCIYIYIYIYIYISPSNIHLYTQIKAYVEANRGCRQRLAHKAKTVKSEGQQSPAQTNPT